VSRKRVYATNAQRQQAYRHRLAERLKGHRSASPIPPKLRRPPSRPARLAALMADVQDLLQEYEHWFDSLPESLGDSEMADRLRETVDQMESILDMLSDLRLPRGFGRD
jgi:hypothetical protein